MDYGALADRLLCHRAIFENARERFSDEACTAACVEAANAIMQLFSSAQADAERAEKAEHERDAAVSDIETLLAYGGTNFDACLFCKNRYCYARNGTKPCYPEWRGPQED